LVIRDKRPAKALVAALIATPPIILATAAGGRTALLIYLGGGLLVLYLTRQRRPSLAAGLIAVIVLTMGISFLREFRAAGTAFREQGLGGVLNVVANPSDQLILTFGGSDNEIFD